jgi:hypothetical protein
MGQTPESNRARGQGASRQQQQKENNESEALKEEGFTFSTRAIPAMSAMSAAVFARRQAVCETCFYLPSFRLSEKMCVAQTF